MNNLHDKSVLMLRDIARELLKDLNFQKRKNHSLSWIAHAKKKELIAFIENPNENEIPVTTKPKHQPLEERLRRSAIENTLRKILDNEINERPKVDRLVVKIREALELVP